jgi:DNA-3-methyladenine glycosylase
MRSRRLARPFFERETLRVARELLGQRLVRLDENGGRLSGRVIETEAYIGTDDLGCHARHGRTARNESMWGPAGHAYVYFTYGMHWMLNIVTERAGFPAAVLIRAIAAEEGVPTMRLRRHMVVDSRLTDGPAKLCQALGIDRAIDGRDLCTSGAELFFERLAEVRETGVTRGPRVGLDSVPEPWHSIPWRFRVKPDIVQSLFEEEPT